jgi:histone deacetylase 1/2
MKPMRLKMVHSLINSYGLTSLISMYYSKQASSEDLCLFHHPQYVKYLETWVTPRPSAALDSFTPTPPLAPSPAQQRQKFIEDIKLGEIFKINQSQDCPGFEGLLDYCQLTAGSSLDAADLIIAGEGDIAINWMGGFHHARKTSASGFCYINDIVLCILELLRVYPRVLYLDIDVHHGDGVEEAFYHTNRVMTVSFHQYAKDFFPETGHISSVGEGAGRGFSVNVPLRSGMDNLSYVTLFTRVMTRVMDSYRPDVVVVQCGADSLSKDLLGGMNLSVRGHGECLEVMKRFGVPLILLGGGGYTIENVARCWTYETGLMLGRQIEDDIPAKDEFRYFYAKEDFKIHFGVREAINLNTKDYLDSLEMQITENLRHSENRPSVPFHRPPFSCDIIDDREEESVRSRQVDEERRMRFFDRK